MEDTQKKAVEKLVHALIPPGEDPAETISAIDRGWENAEDDALWLLNEGKDTSLLEAFNLADEILKQGEIGRAHV